MNYEFILGLILLKFTKTFLNWFFRKVGIKIDWSSKTAILCILFLALGTAISVEARVFDLLGVRSVRASSNSIPVFNSQTIPLLENKEQFNSDKNINYSKPLTTISGNALLAETGPLGTVLDVEHIIPDNDIISIYVVRPGDTLSEIGNMFDVSVNTIIWANDLERGKSLQEGQTLVILPISGVRHVIKKGDTISSVAKKYNGDSREIAQFNNLSVDATLVVGETIIIPNGEISTVATKSKSSTPAKGQTSGKGYFIRPISGGLRTQGIHGNNAVDLATKSGSAVYAAASGNVIVSRSGGWNGGYGNYVVIKHNNGTQTLYAHLNTINVVSGQSVTQGDVIGSVGNTGKSTNPHLHFEVRGATNPF